jgi:hypothetical protein
MPKTKISEWSSTPANNTDIDSINIAEGCAPSGINDAIRELMAQVKDLYAGTSGDTIAVAGGGTGVGTLTGIVKGNGTSAFTAVTAPTGAIVGTTDTQTLTNKTLTAPTIASANLTTALTLTGAAGTSGQVLTSAGTGAAPTWTTVSGGGASAATPTALGTVYGATTGNASPYNVLIGYNAGVGITSGTTNTAIGWEALKANTTGSLNTAIGYQALTANTTGNTANTAVGYQALKANTTGVANLAIGLSSLQALTTTTGSIAIGNNALNSATGGGNLAIGMNDDSGNRPALFNCTSGSQNVAIGQYSLYQVTTGASNVAYGWASGTTLTTGSYNTYLGFNSNASGAGVTGEIVISSGSSTVTGKGSNTGFFSPNAGGVYQGNNSSSWSTTSDQRLKKNIVNNDVGLEKLTQIQVRNFEYRTKEEITELPQNQAIQKTGVQLGVIAQELQAILPDCVKTESTGVMTVDQDNLTWYLINAVKELSARVKQLEGN